MYRNTVTYRYCLIAGLILAFMEWVSLFKAITIIELLFLGLPILVTIGLNLLLFDYLKLSNLKPLKWDSQVSIWIERMIIAVYVLLSIMTILDILAYGGLRDHAYSLIYFVIYMVIGAAIAGIIRFFTIKKLGNN